MNNKAICWTAGTSNRSIHEFINLLKSADIQTVVDVRTRPRSRFWWFNGATLAKYLANEGIAYEHQISLGGYGKGDDYDEVLDSLAARARSGERFALVCSEAKVKDCHRGTDLAPAMEQRGVNVEHLLYRAQK